MIKTLPTGDQLTITRDAAVLHFTGGRKVLSTGALNGGIHMNLTAVYNQNDCPQAGAYCEMMGKTMWEHQCYTAEKLQLDPKTVTGLHTAANMNNHAIVVKKHQDFSVTALVTAGIEVNGRRVGTPAFLDEQDGDIQSLGGTINIVLIVDADLTDGCMTRALVTCTEAKTAAIQELVAADCYGNGLATGSGTDGTILISNTESTVKLSEAGKSFKLGELIGTAVMQAVKEALYRQTGLSAGMQHSLFRRMGRFGVTEEALWEAYVQRTAHKGSISISRQQFCHMAGQMDVDGTIVTLSSLYAHLIDQMLWGLLLPQEAWEAGQRLLALMHEHYAVTLDIPVCETQEVEAVLDDMRQSLLSAMLEWIVVSIRE